MFQNNKSSNQNSFSPQKAVSSDASYQQLNVRNVHLLDLSQSSVSGALATLDKILSQLAGVNVSLHQWRELSTFTLQLFPFCAEISNGGICVNMKNKDVSINSGIILAMLIKYFMQKYSSSILSANSIDHNNLKSLRCNVFLITSVLEIFAASAASTESNETTEILLTFGNQILSDVSARGNAISIKEKDRELMSLYCRILGVVGSCFLSGRRNKDSSLEAKKIALCQDIVQCILGTGPKDGDKATAVGQQRGPAAGGLLKGYLQAVESTALAVFTTLASARAKTGLGLGNGKDQSGGASSIAIDAKNVRKVLVPCALLSALRRILTSAAAAGVARSGNSSGLLGNATILAAVGSSYDPLCQHAACIISRSLKAVASQRQQQQELGVVMVEVDGQAAVMSLCLNLKSRLIHCLESLNGSKASNSSHSGTGSGSFSGGSGSSALSSVLTATYLLRAVATLVRSERLDRVDIRKAILDLLGTVIAAIKESNLKVFIEAVTVFIGEHQKEHPGRATNWETVKLANEQLLSERPHNKLAESLLLDAVDEFEAQNESLISNVIVPKLLNFTRRLFSSKDEKYLQPTILRLISRLGRLLIARPDRSDALLESSSSIGEAIIPLWTYLQSVLSTTAATGGTSDLDGEGRQQGTGGLLNAQLLEQVVEALIWLAPDLRYCEKEHSRLWKSFQGKILDTIDLLANAGESTASSSRNIVCNLFARVQASTIQLRNDGRDKCVVGYYEEYIDALLTAAEKHLQSCLALPFEAVQALAMLEQIWSWMGLFMAPVAVQEGLSASQLRAKSQQHSCQALFSSIQTVVHYSTPRKVDSRKKETSVKPAASAPSLIEFSVKESNEDKQLIRHTLVRQLIDLAKQSCSPLTQRYAIEGLVNVVDMLNRLKENAFCLSASVEAEGKALLLPLLKGLLSAVATSLDFARIAHQSEGYDNESFAPLVRIEKSLNRREAAILETLLLQAKGGESGHGDLSSASLRLAQLAMAMISKDSGKEIFHGIAPPLRSVCPPVGSFIFVPLEIEVKQKRAIPLPLSPASPAQYAMPKNKQFSPMELEKAAFGDKSDPFSFLSAANNNENDVKTSNFSPINSPIESILIPVSLSMPTTVSSSSSKDKMELSGLDIFGATSSSNGKGKQVDSHVVDDFPEWLPEKENEKKEKEDGFVDKSFSNISWSSSNQINNYHQRMISSQDSNGSGAWHGNLESVKESQWTDAFDQRWVGLGPDTSATTSGYGGASSKELESFAPTVAGSGLLPTASSTFSPSSSSFGLPQPPDLAVPFAQYPPQQPALSFQTFPLHYPMQYPPFGTPYAPNSAFPTAPSPFYSPYPGAPAPFQQFNSTPILPDSERIDKDNPFG